MKILILILFLCIPVFANDEINHSKQFLAWLDSHKTEFINCAPKKMDNGYLLCDQTFIKQDQLKNLFKMSPDELVIFIKKAKINLKNFCRTDKSIGNFQKDCIANQQNDAQKKARLQGQFHPDTNTIDIDSNAYAGSLIHEYIHYLQYHNESLFDGKKYKFERSKIQQDLIKLMDDSTSEVQKKLALKDEIGSKPYIQNVLLASEQLMKYSIWQDLIDEKNIFLLYKQFGKEFGVREEDIELANKNMGFICKRVTLPSEQCK